MIVLGLFINGCGMKNQIKIQKVKVPEIFLTSSYPAQREIKTNKDIAIFIIDLSNSLEECNQKINSIKRLNDE